MIYRALIFEDEEEIRKILWRFFNMRRYEVFSYPYPGICPLSSTEKCPCSGDEMCADVILSDLYMPIEKGINFLEQQIKKGCKCKHFALMSGDFSEGDESEAELLSIKIFIKPFKLKEITKWRLAHGK